MDYDMPTSVSRLLFRNFRNAQLELKLRLSSPLQEEVCAYCGSSFDSMVTMKQLELSRYTDWHLHQARTSESFCLPCVTVLRTEDYRRKAVIAQAKAVQFLTRAEPRDRATLIQSLFYSPPLPPFAISIPTDYRKHIMLRARLNYDRSQFHVQYGEHSVLLIPASHRNVYETVERMVQSRTSRASYVSALRPSPLVSLILELTKSSHTNLEEQGGAT